MPHLIFLDIDGTILSEKDGSIHPYTLEGIRRVQAAGHKVFINTGRSRGIIPDEFLDTVKPDGLVCGLGAWIYADGAVRVSVTVPEELLLLTMELAKKNRHEVVYEGESCYAGFGGNGWWGAEHTVASPEEYLRLYGGQRITKLTYYDRALDAEEIEYLSKYFAVYAHPHYAEVGMPGYSKGTGIAYLCRRYGVDIADTVAVGDSHNDMEMLTSAGVAVVMGNADETVKAVGDIVTLPASEGGIGHALKQLFPEAW